MEVMRLGVIDVGSNTVHLLVVDAHPGAHPLPDYSHSVPLRLAEHLTDEGALSDEGADTYKLYAHQNEDIVRLTPEELKAKMAAKERAAAGGA